MGFGKKYISNNIAAKAHISRPESSKLLDNFLSIIKTLPENWKETIKDSINRFERALNQS